MKLEQTGAKQESDFEIEVITTSGAKEEPPADVPVKTGSTKGKDAEVDYAKSKVKEYFEEAGLEVKDMRAKKGALCVLCKAYVLLTAEYRLLKADGDIYLDILTPLRAVSSLS